METTSLIIEHDFDEATVGELNTLRDIRLGIVEKQMQSPEATVDEMIKRGIVPAKERAAFVASLKSELEKKRTLLRERADKDKTFYFDEIELFSRLISK